MKNWSFNDFAGVLAVVALVFGFAFIYAGKTYIEKYDAMTISLLLAGFFNGFYKKASHQWFINILFLAAGILLFVMGKA